MVSSNQSSFVRPITGPFFATYYTQKLPPVWTLHKQNASRNFIQTLKPSADSSVTQCLQGRSPSDSPVPRSVPSVGVGSTPEVVLHEGSYILSLNYNYV